jgi:hypothetical protein
MAGTNRAMQVALAVATVGFMGAASAWAQGMSGHEGHAGMSHGSATQAAAQPQGMLVRESRVQGYALAYRLYSWEERNAMMKGMEGHEMAGMDTSGRSSHHLMLFVRDSAGKDVAGAKVGFIVTGPDKQEFKTLTMAMSGGYGADVPLKAKGTHAIRTKVVIGDRTLNEEFSYDVK